MIMYLNIKYSVFYIILIKFILVAVFFFRFDTGDIVRQHKCIINATETTPELRTRLAEYGADLLMSCIRDLPKCLQRARSQRDELATYGIIIMIYVCYVKYITVYTTILCEV